VRYAVIENDTVINVIEATQDFIEKYPKETVLVQDDSIWIGWTRQGKAWSPPIVSVQEERSPSDELAQQARAERDRLLAECDWTQLPDAPTDKDLWAAYRQALRDIPQQPGFPDKINWPERP